MTTRSAAGEAAGYHFQVQQGLLALVGGGPEAEVSIETLDDLVVSDGDTDDLKQLDLEQLKHSVRPGSLTDRSRPLWKSLEAWMDLIDLDRLEQVRTLILVATQSAPEDSSAALLRREGRDVQEAERRLVASACESAGAADTAPIRARFAALARGQRVALLSTSSPTTSSRCCSRRSRQQLLPLRCLPSPMCPRCRSYRRQTDAQMR